MHFDDHKPIYLQIYDSISERILREELRPDERMPSVREYGADIGVNPNTMMRTYEKLTEDGVIYNKRGIGYFVSPGARERVLEHERKTFLQEELPQIRKRMQLLGIDADVFQNSFRPGLGKVREQ